MNERIKELMDQAGIDVEAVENLGEMPTALKFAELIVRECMYVGRLAQINNQLVDSEIKKNFGVE